jgi:uncharacterized protein (TIGR00369 family)
MAAGMSGFAPRFDGYAAKVRASFARQAMMATFGAELRDVAPGRVEIAARVGEGLTQQHGVAHAALTFGIGDSAAGYAALTLLDEAAEVMTAEMKVNLLAPAAGPELLAVGEVVRPGRRLVVVTASVWSGETRVALMQGTMVPA